MRALTIRSAAPLAFASLLLVMAERTRAQETKPPVVPGLTLHVATPRDVDTVVYQRSVTRAGRDSLAGTRTVVSRVVRVPHGTHLEVEQRFPAGTGEIVDTAIAELPTMRAVAHRSHQPTKTMRFDFSGDSVGGTVTESAGSASAVRQSVGGPIFDSNVIDLVVASLPLAPDLSTTLPFFIYERGGRVEMPVAVRERVRVAFGTLGKRDAWIVSVGVPGAPATVWVDAQTRAVLRVRYDISARDVSFTDERLTPLR